VRDVAPDASPSAADSDSRPFLTLSLPDLVTELATVAQREPLFARAAALSVDLRTELVRLSGENVPAPKRRRTAPRQTVRTARATARLLKAFEVECEALGTTLQQVRDEGSVMTSQQLSDLRLGERTRKVFQEAGLIHVQDLASLPADRAVTIPQLTPASLSELRAAIMFAAEIAGTHRQQLPPTLTQDIDLFAGLVQGMNQLPAHERETVALRTGVVDRVHAIEEVALVLGCPVEEVVQFERHALELLLSQPASLETCWRLEAMCIQLGLGWEDERVPTVVASLYPATQATYTRLVLWLMREKAKLVARVNGGPVVVPQGVAHFEEMVVAALGRYGQLSKDSLTTHVRAALPPDDREAYADIEVSERVRILGPAVQIGDDTFRLPDAPIPGFEDRHIRALNGLIGALQKLGSARIAALTTEVNRRLPRQYKVKEEYVRTWLTQHPELFTQSEADRFKLATLDVDILCGITSSWLPAGSPTVAANAPQLGAVFVQRLRGRLAKDVAEFLRREGPQPIGRIRSHLYGRSVGLASADSVIAAYPHLFVREPDSTVRLRPDDETAEPDLYELGNLLETTTSHHRYFWQRS